MLKIQILSPNEVVILQNNYLMILTLETKPQKDSLFLSVEKKRGILPTLHIFLFKINNTSKFFLNLNFRKLNEIKFSFHNTILKGLCYILSFLGKDPQDTMRLS
jgi:hypothetical protein